MAAYTNYPNGLSEKFRREFPMVVELAMKDALEIIVITARIGLINSTGFLSTGDWVLSLHFSSLLLSRKSFYCWWISVLLYLANMFGITVSKDSDTSTCILLLGSRSNAINFKFGPVVTIMLRINTKAE